MWHCCGTLRFQIEYTVNLKQQEGKVRQALLIYVVRAHQSIIQIFCSSCSIKFSPYFSPVSLSLYWKHCWASVPTESYPRQVSNMANRSPSALVPCAGSCCCRDCELFIHFLPTFLIFCCLDFERLQLVFFSRDRFFFFFFNPGCGCCPFFFALRSFECEVTLEARTALDAWCRCQAEVFHESRESTCLQSTTLQLAQAKCLVPACVG